MHKSQKKNLHGWELFIPVGIYEWEFYHKFDIVILPFDMLLYCRELTIKMER